MSPQPETWPRRRAVDEGPRPSGRGTRAGSTKGDTTRLRRLGAPAPVAVRPGPGGRPALVARAPVATVLEDWVVEDRWWTGRPLRRRYFELVLADGRNLVVFRDLTDGSWYRQRA